MSASRSCFRLVDMPGYGYAKAPPRVAEAWRRLVRDFLRGRVELKRVLLLIDARHGVKPVDVEMMDMLDGAAVSYRLVLTKADKINSVGAGRAVVACHRPRWRARIPPPFPMCW